MAEALERKAEIYDKLREWMHILMNVLAHLCMQCRSVHDSEAAHLCRLQNQEGCTMMKDCMRWTSCGKGGGALLQEGTIMTTMMTMTVAQATGTEIEGVILWTRRGWRWQEQVSQHRLLES